MQFAVLTLAVQLLRQVRDEPLRAAAAARALKSTAGKVQLAHVRGVKLRRGRAVALRSKTVSFRFLMSFPSVFVLSLSWQHCRLHQKVDKQKASFSHPSANLERPIGPAKNAFILSFAYVCPEPVLAK